MTKSDVVQQVEYHCQKCHEPFQVKQGSRRRLCDRCLTERISQGRPPNQTVVTDINEPD